MDEGVTKKLQQFFSQFPIQKLDKGQVLIDANKDPSGIFFLTDGVVKNYAISEKGEELILNVFKPLSFFPVSWVLNHTKGPYYFEAMTNVTFSQAPTEAVATFLKNEPEVVLDLLKRIYRGMDGLFARLEVLLSSGNAHTRLVNELLINARRFGELKEGKTVVSLQLTEHDLASETGIVRETVSRELTVLKEKGLLDVKDHHIVIPDLKKLELELH